MRCFSFEGICKCCHRKMRFCISFEDGNYDILQNEDIHCYHCGCKATPYDAEEFIYLLERLDVTSSRNETLAITQISIYDIVTDPPEDEEF